MSNSELPSDTNPLTPLSFWRESLSTWTDFSRTTTRLILQHAQETAQRPASTSSTANEALPGELLRAFSDLNLSHWQNTARLLESLPSWTRTPQFLNGSALVDWFDQVQRQTHSASQSPAPHSDSQGPTQPLALQAPDGAPDDLTQIKGIGKKLSALLNELGVYHFKQIAEWSPAEAAWVDDYLAFKGRVSRESWIEQARVFHLSGAPSVSVH